MASDDKTSITSMIQPKMQQVNTLKDPSFYFSIFTIIIIIILVSYTPRFLFF